ncbi:hypothetical protein V6238_18515, partial [Marinomonas arenicola]|uniref:hypothetical protein n=1 Tax=Marinomonas arenicola TaxID=569601 RepID=UPI00311E5BB5
KESIELYNSLKIGSYFNPKSLPKDATTFVKNIMAKLGLYVSKRKSQGRRVLSISKSDWDLVNGFVKNRIEKGVHSLKIETHETVKPATKSCSEKQPEAATHKACETGTLPQGGVY